MGKVPRQRLAMIGLVSFLFALAPFAAWTWRNWRTFHVLQPLAPRYAVDPGDSSFPGWQRWVKTWCLDFVSTYNVYWPVPGAPLELNQLPRTGPFDSQQQYAGNRGTRQLLTTATARNSRPTSTRSSNISPLSASTPTSLRYYLYGCLWAAWQICG